MHATAVVRQVTNKLQRPDNPPQRLSHLEEQVYVGNLKVQPVEDVCADVLQD